MNNTPTIITDEKTEAISLMNENGIRRVQNQLMKYLGLNYDDIKKVRGI